MSARHPSTSARLDRWLPQLVVSPAFALSVLFFYGLAAWIGALSLTDSTGNVRWHWVGLAQYTRLLGDETWWLSLANLAKFLPLTIGLPLALGALLAILLDQKIRGEGVLRTLYLYPLALSWIVAGTLWRWMLAPDVGIESFLKRHGFPGASFDWIVNADWSIYAIALVAVWHSTGFVMAMFIAGLRGIDDSIIKAARIDGASLPRVYWSIIMPALRPTVFSAMLILLPAMIKTYLAGWLARHAGAGETWRLLIGVGLLGGFTTFSAFSLEMMMLIERGQASTAFVYAAISVLAGVTALYIGLIAVRLAA